MVGWIRKLVINNIERMRTKVVAGNWKMNLNAEESVQLVNEIRAEIKDLELGSNRVMVFPPFINISLGLAFIILFCK